MKSACFRPSIRRLTQGALVRLIRGEAPQAVRTPLRLPAGRAADKGYFFRAFNRSLILS